ncbi:MAG: dihydrofolate reductase [Acidiferrobacterales bacterium]
MSRVSVIAAMAENRIIGVNNTLPWRLPADLRRFRALTTGHHVIMGRKTFESLQNPLPDRACVILTRDNSYAVPGCKVVHSVDAALAVASDDREIFVIGGASLYAQTLPQADRLYLTVVHANVVGDSRFPAFAWSDWSEVERQRHERDDNHVYAFSFITLDRKP